MGLTYSENMEIRVGRRNTSCDIRKESQTPKPEPQLITQYLWGRGWGSSFLQVAVKWDQLDSSGGEAGIKWSDRNERSAKCPTQDSHSGSLVESDSEPLGGKGHKTLEKHPLGLFLILKAFLLVEEHVLCVVLTNLEVTNKVLLFS